MDPFTEKLLERTRARRENLQKKMADRPNAANRPMVKRPREPLADSNSVISEPATDKAPQPSSKPSPSKRLCSGENVQPAAGEENQEPLMMRPVAQILSDPPTDKKPPVVPGCRQSSSLERTATQPDVQSQLGQLKTVQPEPEKMAVTTAPQNQSCKKTEMVAASPVPQRSKDNLVEDSGPCVPGMKSRLQMLAEQRKFWDGNSTADALPDCTPLSLPKRPAEVPPAAVPSASTGNPVGRRGRLANLAATIGSWEDDLSHANIPKENTEEKPGKAVPKLAVRDATVAASPKPSANQGYSAASSKSTSSYNQAVYSPVKSSRVFPPSPQKADIPAARPALQSVTSPQKSSNQGMTSISSPQKSYNHGAAFPSSPQKAGPSSTASVPPSPLKNQVPSKGLNLTASPQKQELRAKPAIVGPSATQEKTTAGGPVVKSFLERFGEKCQERNNQSSPAGGTIQAKTPTVTPSVTPNTRLAQDRLKASQAANTTTADLTQRQKMERESELAKIRSRFQNGNMWKNKDEATETKKITDIKEQLITPVESEVAPCEPQVESTPSISTEKPGAPTTRTPAAGPVLAVSPPAMTSSPLRIVHTEEKATDETAEKEDMVTEREMNVDQSINSAVINELFDGILEQSEEEEEEDALNISSMSLLTPLAETVAAVVRSPEKRMMTSTPASSFIVKSPESDSKPSKFQRTNIIRTGSSDSVEASDEDHKLPYSISAYRSTRVKETERPHVKQVIVRKEDVSHRAEEPRGSALFSIKQKMKILTSEMNLQQSVIHQASQALNCCTDEEHGKGSQVEAEAERLVLVAMERRGALMAELDRLKGGAAGQKKTPAAPESTSTSASRGSITLQELRLPLKADFVCSIANKPESTKHSFFIMIRAGAENNVATPLASTHRGLSGDTLTFPTKFTISDVSSDFVIDIQVYCLVQKRDVCSDKKKKPSKSKAITPKRLLGITKSVQTPVVASPGGPNAVRTSNFVLVGSHKLTLSSIGKNKFPLEKIKYERCERELLSDMFHTKVPFLCPLEGHIYLKMQCEVGSKVEERGFLTMFEDVSGFGAWHRRWCVLSGYYISYWTYPDDEKCKNPIGRINLANCTSKRVEPVNREFCARPNTFELITVRPQREEDKETLVSQCKNTMCVTTNWLSADTKDERNLWMKKLNQIVVDLRMWQPDACYRPL
ncbi:anillin isoform X2 [Hippoglossus stenolepis]|uniref:anillin isoform X2 n=1 Tax=Hippoglossus stenolepis TaxID=195615 RepID=UPI001FAFC8FD|nr:anillin isoform X2 [Hippoglossus stenolepis]